LPWRQLQADAKDAGFDLAIVSGHRSFERQMSIWNAKASGQRIVYDDNNCIVDLSACSLWEQVQAILRWSALPGASRHHWGTDLDVYDKAAVPANYSVQLSPHEVDATGVFGPLHQWLDEKINNGSAHGFFRPYSHDTGGVASERWHLSYAPLAREFQSLHTVDVLYKGLAAQTMALQETVLENLDEIYQRFVSVSIDRYPI
jgi:LAS superfamily LD-carboxypeptidase LdcB